MSDALTKPELPAMGFVADLEAEERRLLSSYGEFLPVQPGQTIIREGDPQDALFLVISGLLHATQDKSGHHQLLGAINAGKSVGEVTIFDPGPASATVEAREFSQVWKCNRQDLEDFMNAEPLSAAKMLVGIATVLSRRLRSSNEKLAANAGV
ncbi:MAG: cyclic nucleotide-binding domain-containing protein [Verrucomicrobiales bacterium]